MSRKLNIISFLKQLPEMDLGSEEWVKYALVEADRRKCLAKVLDIESEDAVPKGENYSSLMYRVKAKTVNGEGEVQEKALIYKCLPTAVERRYGMKTSGFFVKEAKIYEEVFPLLEKLFKKCGIHDTYWPEFYAVRNNYEGFIMQDLKPLGYKVLDRSVGLDFGHASFVLDALAKIHAGTCALIERGEIVVHDYSNYFCISSEWMAGLIYRQSLEQLANVLENNWKGEWVDYAARLRRYCDTFYVKMVNEFRILTNNPFKVLCHADPWTSNILFIHDKNDKPVSVKFVDYQVSLVGSPAFDLEYFFLTSLKVSDQHRKKELQEGYLRSLGRYLEQFGALSPAPTLAELGEYSKGLENFMFVIGLTLKPLMIMPAEDAVDVDKASAEMKAQRGKASLFKYSCESEHYVNTIKTVLRDGKENGLI